MRFRHLFALSALAFSTTACLDDFPAPDHLGLIVVRAHNNAGVPVVRGSGLFTSVGGLVLVPTDTAGCGLFAYSPTTTGTIGGGSFVDAGNGIGFTVGASTQQATRVFLNYQMIGGAYLNFVTGDTVSVNVPGATGGFEPATAKLRLAEAFTADTLPTWESGVNMNLTWSAPPVAGSVMIVSLRYSNTVGATVPNLEVSCAFADDGAATIHTAFLDDWGAADTTSRSYAFIRIRESIVNVDAKTFLSLRSQFEQPLPSLVGTALRQ